MAIFSAIGTAIAAGFAALNAALAAVGVSLTQLALGLALSALSLLFQPRREPIRTPALTVQGVINQSVAPRRRLYGRGKLGGVRAFWETRGGELWQIIMVHHGEVDGLEQLSISNRDVTIDGGGAVLTAPWADGDRRYAFLEFQSGTPDQGASGAMLATWPGTWTADHRLRGIAYIRATFVMPPNEKFSEIFAESYNTPVRAVLRGVRVRDVRTDVVAWSDNLANVIADYLTSPDGYGRLTWSDLDLPSFQAYANLCDEPVPLAAGGTEPRYRCWGTYALTDPASDVLSRLRACGDAEFYITREGKIGIRGGRWTAPTVTITDDDIISHDFEEGPDALDRFNRLKVVFTSPDHDYQPTEADPWEDLGEITARGEITEDFTVDMVPSFTQAWRLAKIEMAKRNPAWRGAIVLRFGAGRRARDERTIRVVFPRLGLDDTFLVERWQTVAVDNVVVGFELAISSLGPAPYEWTTAEEGAPPALPEPIAPDVLAPPTGLSLLVVRIQTSDALLVPTIQASVDAGRPDLRLEGQIRQNDAPDAWQPMGSSEGTNVATSGPLFDGVVYAVRVRWRSTSAASEWTDEETITVVTNPNAPAAPTSFTAGVVSGGVDTEWINPASNFFRARVYRGTSSSFGSATQIAEVAGVPGGVSGFRDVAPGSGTWFYFVTARNESGVESTPASPVSVTVP